MPSVILQKFSKRQNIFLFSYYLLVAFTGFFIGSFDILVHSNFFLGFGYKDLAGTYIISGFSGIVVSYAYSRLYKKMNPKILLVTILTLVVITCGAYYILNLYTDYIYTELYGMICFFPVNILTILVLWRFIRKLLLPEATRIVYPKMNFYFSFGMLLSGISILFVIYLFYYRLGVVISFSSLFAILLLQFVVIYLFYKADFPIKEKEKFIPVQKSYKLFFSTKYSRQVLFYAILSSMVGFAIHYVFINTAWIGFRSFYGMTKFYSLFIVVLLVFIYGVDRYLIKRLLYSYDSPYSLALLPPILIIALFLALLVKILAGNVLAREHFSLFFLMIAMLQVGYLSAYRLIEKRSFQTLFHSLDLRIRQSAYPRIEGTARFTGLLFVSILILGLSFFKYYSLTMVLILAIVLAGFWFWNAVRMIKSFKKEQESIIGKFRYNRNLSERFISYDERKSKLFSSEEIEKIILALDITARFYPVEYENDLIKLISHPSDKLFNYILTKIDEKLIVDALHVLEQKINTLNGEALKKCRIVIDKLHQLSSKNVLSEYQIKSQLLSTDLFVRVQAVYALFYSNLPDKESILLSLSKDLHEDIRNLAIRLLAKTGDEKYTYILLDFIYPQSFNPYAFEAIVSLKDASLYFLERELNVPELDNQVLGRILHLLGKINTTKATNLLLSKLESADSYILNNSINTLIETKFQASKDNIYKILDYIVKLSGIITSHLNTYRFLNKKTALEILCNAYKNEIEANTDKLFKLLSLIYNPNIIGSLHKMFLEGSRAEISFSVELADQYIDADIKSLIFSFVEDISLDEKIERLDYYFPQPKPSLQEIFYQTLTSDFNSLTIYPRICALILIDRLKIHDFEDEISFCASHPEKVLSETAHFVRSRINLPQNLKKKSKANYRKAIPESEILETYKGLIASKLIKFKQIQGLTNLSEFVLQTLAQNAHELSFKSTEIIEVEEHLKDYSLIVSGTELLPLNGQKFSTKSAIIHVGLLKALNIKSLTLKSEGVLWCFKDIVVNELLYDNFDFANCILDSIENFKLNGGNGTT
ncbi:MAG: hypothetical protein JXA77_18310 [Bacteroidales bacterium]|nr:hypothetical protein [Bacteroidales bacterium]MBN2818139.1 hypothetical protein [Bacteroidales bacterium]